MVGRVLLAYGFDAILHRAIDALIHTLPDRFAAVAGIVLRVIRRRRDDERRAIGAPHSDDSAGVISANAALVEHLHLRLPCETIIAERALGDDARVNQTLRGAAIVRNGERGEEAHLPRLIGAHMHHDDAV